MSAEEGKRVRARKESLLPVAFFCVADEREAPMECKWCHEQIVEGKECDDCWEIRHRAERKPTVALRILTAIFREKYPHATV